MIKYFGIIVSTRIIVFSKKINLIRATKPKNKKIVNSANNELVNLRSTINRKGIPENENLGKIVNIAETIRSFIDQQKSKGRPSDLPRVAKVSEFKVLEHK